MNIVRRCAIYARVSDESQVRGESIAHQISFCQEVARRRSLECNEQWTTSDEFIYVDEGLSGTSLLRRVEVQRLIRDAKERRFEVVLFKGISRFARDTVDALLMLRTLLACGVRVISMEENFDSQRDNAEFVFTIHSALAQAESEKTAIRVRLGAAQKAKQGKWNGQPPFGYRLNPQTQRLEIDDRYAPLIREVFALYLSGYGSRRIAHLLNERGLRTKSGSLWSQRNIARLLRNPAYAGDVVYGRKAQRLVMPDGVEPHYRRKQTIRVDGEQVVLVKDAHPAIVDRETLQRASTLMTARRTKPGQVGRHLLTKGILKCRCGSNMTIQYNGRGTAYYRCIAHAEMGRTACSQRYLRADAVETAVLLRLKADFIELLRWSGIAATYRKSYEDERRLSDVRKQIEVILRKTQLLFEQFSEGVLSNEQFVRLNRELKSRLDGLHETEAQMTRILNGSAARDANVNIEDALCHVLSPRTTDVSRTRQLIETFVEGIWVRGYEMEIRYRFVFPSCGSV